MTKISKKEVLKIADISRVSIHEDEINEVVQQLEAVLTYAERVQQMSLDIEEPSSKGVNVFREDLVVNVDPEPILAQAPEREEDYFVVPKVLDGGN